MFKDESIYVMIKYYASDKYFYEFQSNEQEYKNYKYWEIRYLNENSELHRLDGPAIEYSNCNKYWYKNNLPHIEDGPAL
jgi:hypothetical protein